MIQKEGQPGEEGVGVAGAGSAEDVQRARKQSSWGGGADHTDWYRQKCGVTLPKSPSQRATFLGRA